MASITEHLIKLQELTQTNLDILQAINDSFFTKQNHLSVKVGDNKYAIPSFLSLENKLNTLFANFENLVNAPETGEAFFDFNGNTRAIDVRSYTTTPSPLVLDNVTEYGIENNDIFKDFMTPIPYINLDVKSLPNDTVQVMVKKIIPIHQDLVNMFISELNPETGSLSSVRYPYKNIYKVLSQYIQDTDYVEYDTKMDLPIRKNIGSGIYVIEKIVEDYVDENLDNYITLKFRSDMVGSIYMNSLKYRLFNETIESPLKAGDQLVTFEGNAKVEIIEVHPNTNTIKVKVLNGEFLNLVPSDTNNTSQISSLSKIKFYYPVDFNNDKYIKVPLEEDRYIFVAVAPLNSRMNVQGAWGSGLMIDTYQLTNDNVSFNQYYKSNVRNVGDILFEITSMMSNTLTQHNEEEYNTLVNYKPVINENNIQVIHINKHLNDSPTIQEIRRLHAIKNNDKAKLNEVQKSINDINDVLSEYDYSDNSLRAEYESQLSELRKDKNNLIQSISQTSNQISIAANNSVVPIENAKYRIRGFFDIKGLSEKDHIKGIRVQYRYKNHEQEQGTAISIGEDFTFSDWNDMLSYDRERIASYDNGYRFGLQSINDSVNEPSFNQIDIPISQGETVDIRLKLVYDYGYPFVSISSSWSDVMNIKFPEEFIADVQVTDIISENNSDIETNKFSNILNENGITSHVSDKVTEQDKVYFHKPDNISSGFTTQEQKIIPLSQKLLDMDNEIKELRAEMLGSQETIKVYVEHGDSEYPLEPYQNSTITMAQYSDFEGNDNAEGLYEKDNNGIITTILNIVISNESNYPVKLFSMFPGSRDTELGMLANSNKFDRKNYCVFNNNSYVSGHGIWIETPDGEKIQGGNQFIYFRLNDPNTQNSLGNATENGLPTLNGQNASNIIYPSLDKSEYDLCTENNTIGQYYTLNSHSEIRIPIVYKYTLVDDGKGITSVSKSVAFEVYPSLYRDPIPFIFTVNANEVNNTIQRLHINNRKRLGWRSKLLPKFNTTIR